MISDPGGRQRDSEIIVRVLVLECARKAELSLPNWYGTLFIWPIQLNVELEPKSCRVTDHRLLTRTGFCMYLSSPEPNFIIPPLLHPSKYDKPQSSTHPHAT